MEIFETIYNLENALGNLEYHVEILKKAISLANALSKKTEEFSDEEQSFAFDAGCEAACFNSNYETYAELDTEIIYKILTATEDLEEHQKG